MRNPYNRYMATKKDEALGALIKRYRDRAGLTQAAVAELLSRELGETVRQTWISELESGRRWAKTEVELYGAFVRVLKIPQGEFQAVVFGSPDPGAPAPRTWREVIEDDPTLSDAAKEHLINQYGLLQLASAQERATRPVANETRKRTNG